MRLLSLTSAHLGGAEQQKPLQISFFALRLARRHARENAGNREKVRKTWGFRGFDGDAVNAPSRNEWHHSMSRR